MFFIISTVLKLLITEIVGILKIDRSLFIEARTKLAKKCKANDSLSIGFAFLFFQQNKEPL